MVKREERRWQYPEDSHQRLMCRLKWLERIVIVLILIGVVFIGFLVAGRF